MADIFSALTAKRRRLSEMKQQILADARKRANEIDVEIADLDTAIKTLNDAVKDYICPACKGEGTVRRPDAAGSWEEVTCSACNGTGVRKE